MSQRRMIVVLVLVAVVVGGLLYWVISNTQRCMETCSFATKRFVPAHTDYWTEMRCMMRDKDGDCTVRVPIQHSRFVPDAWFATFSDCKGSQHEYEIDERMFHEPPPRVTHVHNRWKECACE